MTPKDWHAMILEEEDFTLMDMIRALHLKLGFDSQDTGSDQHMSSNSQALIESINTIHIDDSVHCINSLDGNSPCYGDSGGLAYTEIPMVASWLAECGVADYLTGYARVTSAQTFIDWWDTCINSLSFHSIQTSMSSTCFYLQTIKI